MSSASQSLGIGDVHPGAILAESLLDVNGQVEFPKGTAVTAAILDQLRARDVVSLSIVPVEETGESAERAVMGRLEHLFRHAGANPASQELKRQLTTYRLVKSDD